jgi:hypothetical protein
MLVGPIPLYAPYSNGRGTPLPVLYVLEEGEVNFPWDCLPHAILAPSPLSNEPPALRIGHLTKNKIGHLASRKMPQMADASGGFLVYTVCRYADQIGGRE